MPVEGDDVDPAADLRVGVAGRGPRADAVGDALATAVPGARQAVGVVPLADDPGTLAGLDAVVVTAPDPDLVLACLERGLPVLCDPPVAGSLERLDELRRVEESTGRWVQVGFARRHDPRLRELRQRVLNHDVGEVRLLRCVHDVADPEVSGDRQLTLLATELDSVAWLLGQSPGRVALDPVGAGRLVTVHTEGGAVADLELRPVAGAAQAGDLRVEVVGTAGSAEVAVGGAQLAEAHRIMLTAWVRSVRSGVPVGARLADARAALSLVEAVAQSG